MAFALKWTPEATQKYNELRHSAEKSIAARARSGKKKSSKAEGLFKQVHKAIMLLRESPKHPGLNSHEYGGMENPFDGDKRVWDSYAQNKTPGAYRIFWCYGPNERQIGVIAITPHP